MFNFLSKEDESLPMLSYLIRKGNTTVYEWRTGVEPKKIEKPHQTDYIFGEDDSHKADNTEEDKIDFGDFSTVDTGEAQVNLSTITR